MSAGLLGSAVSSSITTSAFDSRRARSSPGASNALTRATAAPRSARAVAPASDRVMPVTACPRRISSATSGRPIAPLAPATNTFMAALQGRAYFFTGMTRSFASRGCRTHASIRIFTLPGFLDTRCRHPPGS